MRYLTVIISLFCILVTAHTARADKRVALVVGNGAYNNAAQLPNPPIDARAMAGVLRNIGFDVVEGTNLTRDRMTERLREFGKKAQGADVAVFFYAGHGIAISGTHYLLPVDADIRSEMDVKLGSAINIDLMLDQTMSDARVKLVFLDACRDNPFAAKAGTNATRSVSVQRGLAEFEMKSGEGTLIGFATGPGQTALDGAEGINSPFTRALIAHITKPGVDIRQAMTEVRAQVNEETNRWQLPREQTNLSGPVYLNPAAAQPGAAASAVTPTASTRALARIASLENGPSVRTRNLSAGVDPATFTEESNQTTEDQIGLDRGQRRDVQRRLTGLGFGTRVTGRFDQKTRDAIARWQSARGYPESGFLNTLQHKALLSETIVTPQASSSERGSRRRHGGGGGGGNPVSFIGGVVGSMFRR